jgi:class 3 adenylate cyclase/tetratricopeptide (TPR) repeat protein
LVDGTLCFVDISGFTALSEKLAARGRVGAEELTEVLSRVFGEMLDLASARGGTLLKFGGDALLLLFESSDHAVQAASAAVEMRAALRKAVEIPTSVGKVRLRMSQGLHSGEVHLFRAVGSHIELIVAGPAASWVTEMEGTAEASEIVVSDATRNLLPEGSVTERKGEGWLLKWRTPRVEPCGFVGMDAVASGDPILVPAALRDHLAAITPDPEHRQATVAFVKLIGIDHRIQALGPVDTASDLSAFIAAATEIADEEGVTFLATDVDLDACKVILVAGVPSTEVDEEGRMLRTVRRIADVDTPFHVKIGVNRGHVFSGEVGSTHRATFTIMGDTVNVAARLMAAAPPGGIYAGPQVVDRSITLFDTERVEPFHVKGKTELVQAVAIGDEIGSRSHEDAADVPFVGRVNEFGLLTDAVRSLQSGDGASFAVCGPTGIGKSRLVDEAFDGVGVQTVEVRAEPYGSANPYRPFRDPVRALLGIERGTNDEMSSALVASIGKVDPRLVPLAPLIGDVAHIEVPPTPESSSIDGRFRQDRTIDAVVDLLNALVAGPLLIIAEDMHWSDAASKDLMARLSHESQRSEWLVVQTCREEIDDEPTVTLALPPLAGPETERLVHAATEAAPLRPDAVAAIVTRSGGNPLFTLELVGALRETGDIDSLPTSLDGVVGSQIDSLGPLPRRVLRYVSVLGRSFRVAVARDLLATQDVALDSATRSTLSGFLEEDGRDRLQFRHAMVRDVAYEGLSYRRRRELHNRAGQLVLDTVGEDEEGVADILGLHFHLGGDAQRAWRYCRMAGDRNMERYANPEAAVQFERAIAAARRLDDITDRERREVWLKLGDVQERSGMFAQSLATYQRATRLTGDDPLARSEVYLRRARAKERAGAFTASLSEATRARRMVEDDPRRSAREQLARTLTMTALIRQAQEQPGKAIAAAQVSSQIAEEVGEERSLAKSWQILDWAYFMVGEPDKAIYSERALDVFRRLGDLDREGLLLAYLGGFAYFAGDWSKALDYYESGRTVSMRAGSMIDAAIAAANIGEVLVNQGLYEKALAPLEEAWRIYSALDFDEGLAFADLLLGRLHGLEGDFDLSIERLEESVRLSAKLGMDASGFEAATFLADSRCRAGDPEAGLRTLEQTRATALSEYADYYAPLLARVHGSILNAAGRTDEAIEVLESGIASADEGADPYEYALLVLMLDHVAPDRADDRAVTATRETLRTLGVRSVPGVEL